MPRHADFAGSALSIVHAIRMAEKVSLFEAAIRRSADLPKVHQPVGVANRLNATPYALRTGDPQLRTSSELRSETPGVDPEFG